MAKKLVKYSVVDAFTDSAFKGNPAAMCLLEEESDEDWLQAVATEFNISETCYLTRLIGSEPLDSPVLRFCLRWFTPVSEVELCGHATLIGRLIFGHSHATCSKQITSWATSKINFLHLHHYS